MRPLFLVPDIHDRPTGGNIYNRRIITELRRRGPVEVVPWVPESGLPPISPTSDTVVIVDSLLVRDAEALRSLRETAPATSMVLLAHYLHCIDPRERSSSAAETERAVLSLFDGAVTTSRYAKRALEDERLSGPDVEAVPPGLDAAYRDPTPERPQEGAPEVLTVANILPGKGLLELTDLLATIDDVPWRWTLVGDDTLDSDFATTVRRRLRASPIADRVQRPGAVPPADLRARYDRADVFVLPSRFETCSMATREAMARGCPVVGYAVGGLPENFGDAAAGRLVEPDRPEALADALRALLTDPDARAEMGGAARRRSRAFPSWKTAADRIRTFLRSL